MELVTLNHTTPNLIGSVNASDLEVIESANSSQRPPIQTFPTLKIADRYFQLEEDETKGSTFFHPDTEAE
ncbi:hypothetical protein ACIP66_03300 [Pseudomonas sp. NPDC088429]|uniref:hypothetical protein n=1 Tax=Pseudomonas sp. NPDC088429 TaxID=3364455 RepID=UPI00380D2841